MKEIIITDNEKNQRLDKFLLKYFDKANKSFVYKMLRKKRIKYNNLKAQGNEMLLQGDKIQMYISGETIEGFQEERKLFEAKRHFGIVYEDKNVIIVSKPAGLLSHPESQDDKETLIDQILYYLYKNGDYAPSKESSFTPAICNRLDRNTSGIIIAGKNLAAVQCINSAIHSKKIDKLYITLVKGNIKKEGELTGFITKDSLSNKVKITARETESSKKISTKYKPLKCNGNYTLLEINLITGKSHQIRAHLKWAGYPVVGDRKYGDDIVNSIFKEKFALSNQFLHAYKMIWHDDESFLNYLAKENIISSLPKSLEIIDKSIFV